MFCNDFQIKDILVSFGKLYNIYIQQVPIELPHLKKYPSSWERTSSERL